VGFCKPHILHKPHTLYKMRDSSWALDVLQPYSKSYPPSEPGSTPKRHPGGYLRHHSAWSRPPHYVPLPRARSVRPLTSARSVPIHVETAASAVQARAKPGAHHPKSRTSEVQSPRPTMRPAFSNPPIIRTPVLDRLLNIRPRQFLLQRALHQLGNLRVRGKAQGNQLRFRQFRNPGS
jgi:hypothetical protein